MLAITGATNASLSNLIFGNYAVEIDQHGCVDTSGCYDLENLGLNDWQQQIELTYYPNPTSGELFVEFSQMFSGTLTVFGIMGQEMVARELSPTHRIELELPEAAGTYVIRLAHENGASGRLVVVRQ